MQIFKSLMEKVLLQFNSEMYSRHVCSLKNGLYLVNIYRNSTDINFSPVTCLYSTDATEKKKSNLILCSETSDFSQRKHNAPVSDELQQCRNVYT